MKNITLFGANGPTGLQIIKFALEKGYTVTAVVRDLASISLKNDKLSIVRTDVLRTGNLKAAIQGRDAVISALGTGTSVKETTIYSKGIKNIIDTMEECNVTRLICISANGLIVNPKNNFFTRLLTKFVLQNILKNVYADMRLMEAEIKQTGLDYTIVRPPRLTNGIAKESYRYKINAELENTGSLSRADLAQFMVLHVEDQEMFKSTVNVSD